jgi:uncharacterized protein YndB with AHSA1/START domain
VMTEQTKQSGEATSSVKKTVIIQAPPEVAWRVFTEKMGSWWPLGTYKIGKANAVDAIIEPRVGGRWYERGDDGSTCDWGRVLAWEPHTRLMLSWEITADWQHDPNLKTEVELRFVADGKNATRVEFEHRRLDLYGARRDEIRGIFDSDAGWKALLDAFAARASERPSK